MVFFCNIKGSSTLGEKIDPAKDCTEIVDNLPDAKDGFYWILVTNGRIIKVKGQPILGDARLTSFNLNNASRFYLAVYVDPRLQKAYTIHLTSPHQQTFQH